MTRRFVIGVEPLDEEQETQLRNFLGRGTDSWWHWIGNLWLHTTDDKDASAAKIRDYLVELNPRAKAVVFEFPEDITWATNGAPNAKGKKISDWLENTWARNSPQ